MYRLPLETWPRANARDYIKINSPINRESGGRGGVVVKAGGDKATLTFIVITREAVSHEERERERGRGREWTALFTRRNEGGLKVVSRKWYGHAGNRKIGRGWWRRVDEERAVRRESHWGRSDGA